jgi:hypothetical protein
MWQADYPLLEFDATHKAVLEPTLLFPLLRVPEHAFASLSSAQADDKREQRNQYRHHDICHAHIRINFTSLAPLEPLYSQEMNGSSERQITSTDLS